MVLEVDPDGAATLIDKAAQPPIVYEGDLVGKVLEASAQFDVEQTQSVLHNAEFLSVTFEAEEGLPVAPTRFVGTLKSAISKEPKGGGAIENLGTVTWQLTGVRKAPGPGGE